MAQFKEIKEGLDSNERMTIKDMIKSTITLIIALSTLTFILISLIQSLNHRQACYTLGYVNYKVENDEQYCYELAKDLTSYQCTNKPEQIKVKFVWDSRTKKYINKLPSNK